MRLLVVGCGCPTVPIAAAFKVIVRHACCGSPVGRPSRAVVLVVAGPMARSAEVGQQLWRSFSQTLLSDHLKRCRCKALAFASDPRICLMMNYLPHRSLPACEMTYNHNSYRRILSDVLPNHSGYSLYLYRDAAIQYGAAFCHAQSMTALIPADPAVASSTFLLASHAARHVSLPSE